MKSLVYVLVWMTVVCGAWSLSQRHLDDVKPFLGLHYVQRDVQVPETNTTSFNPLESCSGFSNIVHCFKLELLNNVSDILDSEKYWLSNNVVIEKLHSVDLDSRDYLKNHALRMQLKKYIMSGKESNRMILEGTMGIFRSHSLRWIVLPDVSLRLMKNPAYGGKMDMTFELGNEDSIAEGSAVPRTFFRRKMQFALLSVMYKMGVMSTLLGALVIISLKSLAVGMVLLFLTGFNTIKAIGAKLHGFYGHHHSFPSYHVPEVIESSAPATPHKEVHVHIHNSGGHHGYVTGGTSVSSHSSGPGHSPYHGWSSSGSGFSPLRRSSIDTNIPQTSGLGKEEEVVSF